MLGTMTKVLKSVLVFGLVFLAMHPASGQAPKSDISSVVAAGKVEGDVYTNKFFGISLTAPKAHFSGPSRVDPASRMARLVDVVYDSPQGAMNYTVAILADSLENYPKQLSMTDYVRRVRRELEKDGLVIHREEVSLVISGVHFTGIVLKVIQRANFGYYRGIYSSFINGYIVSFDVQSGSEERLQQLLSSEVKIIPN